MKKKKIYVTCTHYDENGRMSRIVKPVNAEILEHRGHRFGVYHNTEEKVWTLVDLASGLSVTSNKTKKEAISRIHIPLVFEKYKEAVKKDFYPRLVAEHDRLVEDFENEARGYC